MKHSEWNACRFCSFPSDYSPNKSLNRPLSNRYNRVDIVLYQRVFDGLKHETDVVCIWKFNDASRIMISIGISTAFLYSSR